MPLTERQIIGHLRPAVAKDLLRRGFKIQARARILLNGGGNRPRRVDTGFLRSDIQVQLVQIPGPPRVRVGTNRRNARWVHDGTGIYGPRKMPITPKTRKALKFTTAKYGTKRTVIVRQVKGMKKNEFLKDALPAAKG
jgi:hypothetical protein